MEDDWLTIADVAAGLKVSEETVRRWIRSGTLAVLSLPGGNRAGYRIQRGDLERFIDAHYGMQKRIAQEDTDDR